MGLPGGRAAQVLGGRAAGGRQGKCYTVPCPTNIIAQPGILPTKNEISFREKSLDEYCDYAD